MNAVVAWFVIGAALMVAELFTPAFIIVFFGVGAWAAALVAAVHPGLEGELVAFLAVSVLSLFLLRRRLVTTFQGRRTEARQGAPEFAYGRPSGRSHPSHTRRRRGRDRLGRQLLAGYRDGRPCRAAPQCGCWDRCPTTSF